MVQTLTVLRQKKQVSLSTNMVQTLTAQTEETGQSLNKRGPHPHCAQTEETGQSLNKHGPDLHCSDRRNRSVSQQTWSPPSLCSDRRNRSVSQQTWSTPSLLRQKKQVSLSTNMVHTLTAQSEETGQSLNKHGPHPHCSDRRNRSVSQQTWSTPSLLRQKKQVSLSTNVVHTLTVLRQKKQVSLSTNMVQTFTAQTEETGQSLNKRGPHPHCAQTEETGQSLNKHGPHPHCSDRRNRSVSQQTWSTPSLLSQKKQVSLSTNMVHTLTAQTEETGQSLNKHGPHPHCSVRRNRSVSQQTWSTPSLLRQKKQVSLSTNMVHTLTAQTEETGQSLNKHGPHPHCSDRRNRSVSQQTWSKPSLFRQKKQVSHPTNMVQTLTAQTEETGQSLNKHGPNPHCSDRRNRSVSQQTWSTPSLLRQKKQVSLSTNMVQTLTAQTEETGQSLNKRGPHPHCAQTEETGQSLNKHGPDPHCSDRRNRSVSQQTWSKPSLFRQKKQVSHPTNMVHTLTAQTEETGQSLNKHGPNPHCSDRRNRSVTQQTWSTPSLCSDRRNRSVSQQTWSKPSLLRQKKQVSLSTNMVQTLTVLRQKKQVSLSTNMVHTVTAQSEETGQSLNKHGPNPHCSDRRNRSVSQQTWSRPSLLSQKKQVSLSTNMVHTLTAQSEETGQSLNKHGPNPHCSVRRNRSVSQQTWSRPSLCSDRRNRSVSQQTWSKPSLCSDRRNRSVSQQTWSRPSLLSQKKQVSLSTNMVHTLTAQSEETGQSLNKHGPHPHCSVRRNRSVSQQTWSKPSLLRQKKQVSHPTNMVQTLTAQTEETGQSLNKRGPHPHCAPTEETGQSLNKRSPHPHCAPTEETGQSLNKRGPHPHCAPTEETGQSLNKRGPHLHCAPTEETGQSLNKHGPDPHCAQTRNRSVSTNMVHTLIALVASSICVFIGVP